MIHIASQCNSQCQEIIQNSYNISTNETVPTKGTRREQWKFHTRWKGFGNCGLESVKKLVKMVRLTDSPKLLNGWTSYFKLCPDPNSVLVSIDLRMMLTLENYTYFKWLRESRNRQKTLLFRDIIMIIFHYFFDGQHLKKRHRWYKTGINF